MERVHTMSRKVAGDRGLTEKPANQQTKAKTHKMSGVYTHRETRKSRPAYTRCRHKKKELTQEEIIKPCHVVPPSQGWTPGLLFLLWGAQIAPFFLCLG